MKRRGIFERLHAVKDRQEHARRQPKTVEGRQGIEEDPSWIEINMGSDLANVRHQIGLAEDHAARCTKTARGEQNDARRVRSCLGPEPARHGSRSSRKQLIAKAKTGPDIFEIVHLADFTQGIGQVFKLALFDKAVSRIDAAQASDLDRGLKIANAGCEVEHGRHAAKGMERKEGHDDRRTRWQQQSDPFTGLGHRRDLSAERKGCPDQSCIAQRITVLIFEDQFLGTVEVAGLNQCIKHRALTRCGVVCLWHYGVASLSFIQFVVTI